jgi:hypothetical protein
MRDLGFVLSQLRKLEQGESSEGKGQTVPERRCLFAHGCKGLAGEPQKASEEVKAF